MHSDAILDNKAELTEARLIPVLSLLGLLLKPINETSLSSRESREDEPTDPADPEPVTVALCTAACAEVDR